MSNLLINFTATFRKPLSTVPKTYEDDISIGCTKSQITASQKYWAKFSGVFYDYKICVVLPSSKINEITENWRIKIDGIEYEIKEINHKSNNFGYDHTTFSAGKI